MYSKRLGCGEIQANLYISHNWHLRFTPRFVETMGSTGWNCFMAYIMHSEVQNDPQTVDRGRIHQQMVFWPTLGPFRHSKGSKTDPFSQKPVLLEEKLLSAQGSPGNNQNSLKHFVLIILCISLTTIQLINHKL